MLTYMDLVQQCFYSKTGWSWDNTYEHILSTPNNLLNFPIPNGFNVFVSSRNTDFNFSSISISQVDRLSGSLSYLSSSVNLDEHYRNSKALPINSVVQGYRDLDSRDIKGNIYTEKPFMIYGKMYFPSKLLEGMIIKRFRPDLQLIVKFINTPKLNKLTNPTTIFTIYLQRQTENSSHDFIYSTREHLFGFRCLYHFDILNSSPKLSVVGTPYSTQTDVKPTENKCPSKLSAGCELWYSAGSVSPGISIAARYTTYIDTMRYLIDNLPTYTPAFINSNFHPYLNPYSNGSKQVILSIPYAISTIHPLTFTMAINPLLGTLESTYAIKSEAKYTRDTYHGNKDISYMGKMGFVFSSKYQFNIYSYESDLILGAQLLRSKILTWNNKEKNLKDGDYKETHLIPQNKGLEHSSDIQVPKQKNALDITKISQHNVVYKVSEQEFNENNTAPATLDDVNIIDEDRTDLHPQVSEADEDYISSLKLSGSIGKKNLRLSWEGKFHDWIVSSGVSMDMKGQSASPRVLKYGIEFCYNS